MFSGMEAQTMLNMKWTIAIAVGLMTIGHPSWTKKDLAHAQSQPQTTQPRSQTSSTASLARDEATYTADVRLTNACIDQGGSKADCICVVQVLKYELSLSDYRNTAQTWSKPVHINARTQSSPARSVESPLQTLTKSPDFGYRCQVARGFFAKQTR
jgi:hypothetical protein